MVWWWYCKVGVCLPHFLRSVFFPPATLPACDIILMCPVLTNVISGQEYCTSWDVGGSGRGESHEKIWCIYFWFEKWNASDVCCLFWKRGKTNMRLNIFYHLQSVWILAQCAFHINKLIFKWIPVAAKGIRPFISVSNTDRAHISGSNPPLLTSIATSPTRPTQTCRL